MRDMLGTQAPASAGKCDAFLREQIEALRERARARGEKPAAAELIVGRVGAPLMHRILFADEAPAGREVALLLEQAVGVDGA